MSDASPVETVTTPVLPRPTDRPSRRVPATSSAASSSSSRSAQRMTPAARSAASTIRSSPASDPEWATGGGLRLGAAAHLDGEDRLADLERAVGQREEPLRPLEALDEQDDGVGLRVVQAVGQVIAQVEHDLRAAADDARPADPGPGVDERVRHAARLGDPGDPAAAEPRVEVADVRRAAGREVDHAHAVRARGWRCRSRSRSRGTSACIRAAASPPSTTPPPGMTTVCTPAAAASRVNWAARSGLTASTTVSGTSGSEARSG